MVAFLVRNKLGLLVLILILAVAFGVAAYFIGNPPSIITSKGISGVFNVNGVIPSGSTITLLQREAMTDNPLIPFATGISPNDEGVWGFQQSVVGKSYEIQGLLVYNGDVVYRTSPIFVSAPAIDQVLSFNVPGSQASIQKLDNATISGQVGINGYIPPGSTITIEGRKMGEDQFTVVNKGLPARDNQTITYSTAIPGQTYEIRAILYDPSGVLLGTSTILVVAAPAYDESLTINSLAVPPATPTPTMMATPTSTQPSQPTTTPMPTGPTATPTSTSTPTPTLVPTPVPSISGTIQFNGQAQTNTRIVIFQRVTGTQNFQVAVNNVPPANGATWQWTGIQPGTSYDLIAVLKQAQSDGTDLDLADSNIVTVTAPAANEIFTINSGFVLSPPGTNITVSCSNYSSNNQIWTATVNFGNMSNALSYWYQIGISNGGSELSNIALNATNNSAPTLTVQFTNDLTYYARYAYGVNYGMAIGNAQYSPFSPTVPLNCTN